MKWNEIKTEHKTNTDTESIRRPRRSSYSTGCFTILYTFLNRIGAVLKIFLIVD